MLFVLLDPDAFNSNTSKQWQTRINFSLYCRFPNVVKIPRSLRVKAEYRVNIDLRRVCSSRPGMQANSSARRNALTKSVPILFFIKGKTNKQPSAW